MIGDRIIIQERHIKYAQEILPKIPSRAIVSICGTSGTGKSEVADCLQEMLYVKGVYSITISLDDFYNVHHKVRNYNRKKLGLDTVGLNEIDWEQLKRICKDFTAKKPIHFRRVHKYADVIEHNVIDTDDIDVLIFEGLYAGYIRKFGLGDLNVFLEGNPAQTLEFRQLRRKENENDSFRQDIVQKEFKVICQIKRYSDLVIPFLEI